MHLENLTITSEFPALSTINEKSVPEFLLRRLKNHEEDDKSFKSRIFLIDGISNKRILYSDLEPLTRRLASAWWKSGLRKGDIIIQLTSFQVQYIPLALAVWRANGIIRTLYKDDSEATIAEKISESEAKFVLCDEDDLPLIETILKLVPFPVSIIICGDQSDDIKSIKGHTTFHGFLDIGDDDPTSFPTCDLQGDDVALILPTSGTTGPSKGGMHSHASLLASIRNDSYLPWSFTKPNLIVGRATHTMGTVFPMIFMAEGLTVIVLPRVNIETIAKAVDQYKPGFIFGFPSFILSLGEPEVMKKYDITSVETVLTAGVVITPKMKEALLSLPGVKHVCTLYGMTETLSVAGTSTNSPDRSSVTWENVPESSVGKVMAGMALQIQDQITQQSLPLGEIGEICLKGPYTFKGYFKNEEATKELFDVNGWVHSGDIGYVDENGFLFVVGRAKDNFKHYNNHISPVELEDVILSHEMVMEAVVFPVEDVGGHIPRAVVKLKSGNSPLNLLQQNLELANQILEYANGKLPDYKQLKGGLVVVNELPTGKTGKVSRDLVAALYSPKSDVDMNNNADQLA